MALSVLLVLAVVLSAGITGMMRRFAVARQLVDIPNARSSHEVPTPRAGGVSIAVTVLSGLALLWGMGFVSALTLAALAGGALPVAAVGYLDDRTHVPARFRLIIHMIACAWVVACAVPLPELIVSQRSLPLAWLGVAIIVFAMAWLVNLYNFMDGIDGLAGAQALTVGSVLAALLWQSGATDLALVAALVAASAAGFLVWNWPPARIFMGDIGSGFLGLIFAALVVLALADGALTLWAILIPMGAFIVDASYTLLRRLLRRERVHEAHRTHAYQHAAQEFGSHLVVTMVITVINLLWLAPAAWWASHAPEHGALALLVAWLPLVALCARFRAGLPD